LKVVNIPDKVKEIRQGAFADCAALRTLDIPESVSRIGAEVFSGCKMETLYIRGGLEKECFAYKIFGGMDTTATLYVLPSEIENFMRAYKGTVLPLP
jgi:hypothetical protein